VETQTENIRERGVNYILVEFKGHRRSLYRNPYEFPFTRGDTAIVEADQGYDAGIVRYLVLTRLSPPGSQTGTGAVVRRALLDDLKRIQDLRESEIHAVEVCRSKVTKHRLSMKVLDAEYRFDGLKLTFYFTAEGRVDFRELVRDLAGTFRVRSELRQIGSRDEVKRSDSYGVCGQKLCCSSFLQNFQPVTTHMAKLQNLILNPVKLSGVCGRLKCCLRFEYDQYSSLPQGQRSPALIIADEAPGEIDKLSD